MPTVIRDPFNPVLLNSEPLEMSEEQKDYIMAVLKTGASDSFFAKKMYDAIELILKAGDVTIPIISSLSPSSAEIGSESFNIHVMGTGFTPNSTIVFNGFDEPTTYVSETELTTGVNMPLWQAPVIVPVTVRNSNGVTSDPVEFEFTPAVPLNEETQGELPLDTE